MAAGILKGVMPELQVVKAGRTSADVVMEQHPQVDHITSQRTWVVDSAD